MELFASFVNIEGFGEALGLLIDRFLGRRLLKNLVRRDYRAAILLI